MLLTSQKTNTGRQIEIDLLKAFTVVFSMIIIHVYDFDTMGFENGFTWFLDIIFGGILAAPMFMFCMGIGMEYSRSSEPLKMVSRGLRLLTVGQALNLFRYAIPFAIQAMMEPEYDLLSAQALNFSSDIMQLAGLSFLLMGLLCRLRLRNWQILLAAVLMSLCGTLLEHVQTGYYGLDQFLGLFWGTDTESFFPLFNWFIFIAAGRCFGSLYQKVANKGRFLLLLAPAGILSFAATWLIQRHTGSGILNSFDALYYGFTWMRLPDALSVILMAPALISIFYIISKILPARILDVAAHPSRHINQYYCVSWCWIMVVRLDVWANSSEALMSIWLNILTFTILTVTFYNHYLKERVEAICLKRRTLLTILVWTVTLGAAFYAIARCEVLPNVFNGYLMD